MAQQLYAKIKRSSKYEYQNQLAIEGEYGLPFAVEIDSYKNDPYPVKGGPGGQYRLSDVNLFVKSDDGTDLRIA